MNAARQQADTGLSCPACGEGAVRALGTKNGWPLLECGGCRSMFVERGALPTEAEIYEGGHPEAEGSAPPLVAASLERLVRECAPFRSTGRWLDLGFGQGDLLDVAGRLGWICYGTELARTSLEHGTQRGWQVSAEPETDGRFPAGGFDVVTLIELLEHVPDPVRLLRSAARWLRPGGCLYLTTPHAASLNRRCLGLEWSVVAPPEHLTLWTARGLRLALEAGGLRVVRMRTEGLNPGEIVARACATRGAPVSVNRNQAAARLNEALSRSTWRRGLKRGANACLTLLRLGDTLKAWAKKPEREAVTKG
jgi:2-polyprenyl-3-methyl-5-hydroxy-6-metoxy-1,4-benzoquinol methylase